MTENLVSQVLSVHTTRDEFRARFWIMAKTRNRVGLIYTHVKVGCKLRHVYFQLLADSDFGCSTHLSQTSHNSVILVHYTHPVRSTNCHLFFMVRDRAIQPRRSGPKKLLQKYWNRDLVPGIT